MKGQAQVMAAGSIITVAVVMVLIGLVVYGLVSDVYPHEQTINNETMCTTCVNGSTSGTATTYQFDNIPVSNDSTMICFNASANLMTNGLEDGTCLGYNVFGDSQLNITNTSAANGCQITDVVCTYTWVESNTNEQAFYNSNTSVTFSGFTLLSIAGIILAAVVIVLTVLLIRG